MSRIAILVHRNDDFKPEAYLLPSIADVWQSEGIEVSIFNGPKEARDADIAILHVDLTVIPPEYTALAGRYPKCLNRYTADISKRAISRHLVRPGDGYAGPVIVKSNRNSGGLKEAERAAAGQMPHFGLKAFKDYVALDTQSLVPDSVWRNPDLVVEQFRPEIEDAYFCVRLWYFLGDAEFHSRSFSHDPIVKASNTVKREPIPQVPRKLREIREELGFDYGKFDYTLVDGEVTLFDVNRTPSTSSVPWEMARQRSGLLAPGIKPFI